MTVDPHVAALLGLPRLGPRRLQALLDAFDDPGRAWEAVRAGRLDDVDLHVGPGHRAGLIGDWRRAAADVAVDDIVARHVACGVTVLGPDDDDWPDGFTHDPEPPMLVFVRGDPSLLSVPSVAIVGTRRCTAAGASVAKELGHDLAAAGLGVVSGLALGIDGAAHRGALAAGGRAGGDRAGGGQAIGVVATGLDVVYPRRHAGLWDEVGTGGVLVSESPLGTNAERWRFPARNRLIAALAMAVVVVESRATGGSMHTVVSAIERQTDVLAVPGPVRAPTSDGPNQLLADGCGVVRDVSDVLVALGSAAPLAPHQLSFDGTGTGPTTDPAAGGSVTVDCPVARAVSWPPSSLDRIVADTGLSFADVATRLAVLELEGVIERRPDGYQRRVRS